jgi:protein TonB
MLTILLDAGGARVLGTRPSMLASFVVHGGLVALAVLGTQAPPPVPFGAVHDTTIFLPSDPRPARPVEPGRPPLPGLPRIPRPTMFVLPTTIPLPDLVVPGVPTAPGSADPWPVSPGTARDTGNGGGGLPGAVVDARVVESPPMLLSHPPLRYPEVLRQAGIEGDVMVEAVLDTLGNVERGSLRITRGAHALFEAEARAVVAASRYRPGRMAERAVRVRIQVPVRFALRP